MPRAAALLGLVLLAFAAACASPTAREPSPAPLPYHVVASPVDRATLSEVERRGCDIYLRDIAAHRATDAARTEVDLARTGAVGWIVVPYEQGLLVRFVDGEERAVVDVSVDPESALRPFVMPRAPAEALTPREKQMWRALQLAAHQSVMGCSDRYNSVVIPADDAPDSDWLVYLLAATVDPSRIMLGGHHRFRIAADGRTVLEHLPLSKSCLSMQYTEATAMIVISHVVTPEPVETQVFLNLLHDIPVDVLTLEGGRHWRIEGGRIREEPRD